MSLVLTFNQGTVIRIGPDIKIRLIKSEAGTRSNWRIMIDAPKHIQITRDSEPVENK
jgi:sRNA-binding carbon storage regulator CsrA